MSWKCDKCKFVNPDEEDTCLMCGIETKPESTSAPAKAEKGK